MKRKSKTLIPVKRARPRGVGKVISPATARILERRHSAFQMRKDGYTTEEIGIILGVSAATIADDLRVVLAAIAHDTRLTADEEREIESAKLDAITRSFMPLTRERKILVPDLKKPGVMREKMVGPDPTAAGIVLTASVHKRKLKALDIPETKKLEVSAIRQYIGVDMDKV